MSTCVAWVSGSYRGKLNDHGELMSLRCAECGGESRPFHYYSNRVYRHFDFIPIGTEGEQHWLRCGACRKTGWQLTKYEIEPLDRIVREHEEPSGSADWPQQQALLLEIFFERLGASIEYIRTCQHRVLDKTPKRTYPAGTYRENLRRVKLQRKVQEAYPSVEYREIQQRVKLQYGTLRPVPPELVRVTN
jgi:hypothetical protein